MKDPHLVPVPGPTGNGPSEPPVVEVVIEVPRGSFLKRGSSGSIDFVSPLPCPFNYGAVPTLLGLEGDLLDALVLGPRLRLGKRVHVKAWAAVTLTDRGLSDDKLICSDQPPSLAEYRNVLRFFHFYAKCKGLLNFWRRPPSASAAGLRPRRSWALNCGAVNVCASSMYALCKPSIGAAIRADSDCPRGADQGVIAAS